MGKDWDDMCLHSGTEYRASMYGKSMMQELEEARMARALEEANYINTKKLINDLYLQYYAVKDTDPVLAAEILEMAESLVGETHVKEKHR